MIARTLVPRDARPPATDPSAPATRRRPSSMVERTLIPPALPIVPLDGHSTIPLSLPLEAIASRVVVPRDLKLEAIVAEEKHAAVLPAQPTELDARIAIPTDAAPPVELTPLQYIPPDLVEADVFTTGDVHFLAREQKKEESAKWNLYTRISSVALHVLVMLAVLLGPKLIPDRPNSQDDREIARRQLTLLLPPGLLDAPKAAPRPARPESEPMHVDPRILRRVAPPAVEPKPLPGQPEPERVVKELPNAPSAQPSVPPPEPPKMEAPRAPLKLETPDQQQKPAKSLVLPKLSPGKSIEESIRGGAKGLGSAPIASGGSLPGGGGLGSPGGGGAGAAYGALEMITPSEGVDFSNYLARVYASVKQNWFAVMPESVRLGDRGMVVLQFKILRNGGVPTGEPALLRTSGKEPLDRAAVSSIRASNPFEPLPSAFSGPYIELRFTYLYNLPLSYATQQ